MQLLELQRNHMHCIRTKKVYDWVNRIVRIKEKEVISFPHKKNQFTDCICCDFKIECNSTAKTTLWQGIGIKYVTATIKIELASASECELDIFTNGEKIKTINKGDSYCATLSNVKSVEVQCRGQNLEGCCSGEFQINLHYTNEEMRKLNIKDAICFLSDEDGNPLNPLDPGSITCEELSNESPRENVSITLQNGKKVILQKVTVMKSGFYTVKFFNTQNEVCMVCTYPFIEVETFHLCAPTGTELKCNITDFECEVKIIPQQDKDVNCVKVQIFIQLCQSIQVVGDVKVEVLGTTCKPREDVKNIFTCPAPEIQKDCPLIPI